MPNTSIIVSEKNGTSKKKPFSYYNNLKIKDVKTIMKEIKGSQTKYLHDEKVRVVNVKANRTKEILYSGIVCIYSID